MSPVSLIIFHETYNLYASSGLQSICFKKWSITYQTYSNSIGVVVVKLHWCRMWYTNHSSESLIRWYATYACEGMPNIHSIENAADKLHVNIFFLWSWLVYGLIHKNTYLILLITKSSWKVIAIHSIKLKDWSPTYFQYESSWGSYMTLFWTC